MSRMESFKRIDRDELRTMAPVDALPAMGRAEWLLLLSLALIWGSAFVFIKIAVRGFEPMSYVWVRVAVAAVAMLAWLRLRGERLDLDRKAWAMVALLALSNNIIPFILFGWGQRHIASGLAAILQATTPIFGVLIAHFLTRDEKLTPARLVGVLIGFVGVATMIGPNLLADVGDHLLAQLACLAGALLYALAGIQARSFKARGVTPARLATAQFVAGAVLLAPVALLVDQPWTAEMPPLSSWAAEAVLALICSAFAYVLFFRLIERAGATNAMLVTLLVPPIAVATGALAFGERLGVGQFAGLVLIALGLTVIDGRLWKRRVA